MSQDVIDWKRVWYLWDSVGGRQFGEKVLFAGTGTVRAYIVFFSQGVHGCHQVCQHWNIKIKHTILNNCAEKYHSVIKLHTSCCSGKQQHKELGWTVPEPGMIWVGMRCLWSWGWPLTHFSHPYSSLSDHSEKKVPQWTHTHHTQTQWRERLHTRACCWKRLRFCSGSTVSDFLWTVQILTLTFGALSLLGLVAV